MSASAPAASAAPGLSRVVVAGLALALAVTAALWSMSSRAAEPLAPAAEGLMQPGLAAAGVRLERVGVAAGGGMVDVRFQVIDLQRAESIHGDGGEIVAVVHEPTGIRLDQPWMGHGHGEFHAGSTYSSLLLNPGGLVQRGDLVTVVLGDGAQAHVRVE